MFAHDSDELVCKLYNSSDVVGLLESQQDFYGSLVTFVYTCSPGNSTAHCRRIMVHVLYTSCIPSYSQRSREHIAKTFANCLCRAFSH